MLFQQTGVAAMTPCISTSNKTAWKLLQKVKLLQVVIELPDVMNKTNNNKDNFQFFLLQHLQRKVKSILLFPLLALV